MLYRNAEKYYDPTAGKALSKVMKEHRQSEKEKWARLFEIKHRPKVYVVSRYAGDVEANIAAAVHYCRYVIENRCIPVASHLLYPQMLKEVSKRYGGLENLGDKLLKTDDFALAIDEVVWLLTLLANQGVQIHNLLYPKDYPIP